MNAHIPLHDETAVFKRYMAGLLEGDTRAMSAVIDELLQRRTPVQDIYHRFIQRGMYEVGLLWESGEIPVSTEHLASSATQVVLSQLYPLREHHDASGPQVIITCVPNEAHDIGTLIIANQFESAGWRALLLGANTPIKDLLAFIEGRDHRPDLLALSATMPENLASLEEALDAVTARFPDLAVVIGGQALEGSEEAIAFRNDLLARYPSTHHVKALGDLEHFVHTFPRNAGR